MTNCADYILLMQNTFGEEKHKKKRKKILKHVFAIGFRQQNRIFCLVLLLKERKITRKITNFIVVYF